MNPLRSISALALGEVISRAATLGLTLVIGRTAGLEFLAQLTLAQSILAFATVTADAGLSTHAVRRLRAGDDRARIIRETTSVQVLICVVALLVVIPFAAGRTQWLLVLLLALVPLTFSIAPNYLLQGDERFGWLAASKVVTAIVTVLSGLILLRVEDSALVALCYGLGALAGVVVTIRSSVGSIVGFFRHITLKVKASWASASGWLILQTLIVHAYATMLLVVGSYVLPDSQFTQLATALKVQGILVIPAILLETLLLTRYATGHRPWRLTAATAVLSGVGSLVAALLAKPLLRALFGGDADDASGVLQVLCAQVPLAYVSSVLLTFLIARGYYGASSAIYATALGLLMLGAAYAEYIGAGAPGLAWALVVSEAIFVLALVAVVRASLNRKTGRIMTQAHRTP